MDDQRTDLEERLSEVGRAWGAPGAAPAEAFLNAVKRRRVARRIQAGGLIAVMILTAGVAAWLARGWRAGPVRVPVIATSPESPDHDTVPGMGSPRAVSPTVAQLVRMNRGALPENPVLPEPMEWRVTDRAMRPLDSLNSLAFDAALSGV